MHFLVILIYLFFFTVFTLKYKNINNPYVLFNFVWLVLIIISLMGNKGILLPSNKVYEIFIVGGITFNIVSFFVIFTKNISINYKIIKNEKIKKNIIVFTQFVIFIYYFLKCLEVINQLKNGYSYTLIRSYYYSDVYFKTQLEYLIVTYLIDPLILLTEIIISINIFNKSYKAIILIIMFLNIAMRTFVSGGRMILFEFVIIVLFTYLTFNKHIIIEIFKKMKIILVTIALTIGAVVITTIRGNEEGSFLDKIQKMIVVNFTGSFTYLSTLIDNNTFDNSTFGRTMLGGLIDPFVSIFRYFGLTNIETTQVTVGNINSKFVSIGEYSYNAMPTMYYYFLTDFGFFGIIIGVSIFAFFANYTYKKFIKLRSVKNYALYILTILAIIESPMTWLPFKTSFVMCIIFVFLLLDDYELNNRKM